VEAALWAAYDGDGATAEERSATARGGLGQLPAELREAVRALPPRPADAAFEAAAHRALERCAELGFEVL
jgi:hypothetical protein